jgi:hypothetical protein
MHATIAAFPVLIFRLLVPALIVIRPFNALMTALYRSPG